MTHRRPKHLWVLPALWSLTVACSQQDDAHQQDVAASAPTIDASTKTTRGDAGTRFDAGRPPMQTSTSKPSVAWSSQDGGPSSQPARADGCPSDAPLAVNRVRVLPGPGGGDLVGSVFQGSNEGTTVGFRDLGVLTDAPAEGSFAEVSFANTTLYRFVRFYDPEGRVAPLAELAFYHDTTKLSGEGFGTVDQGDHPFSAALDDDMATYFEAQTPGGNYVGLDLSGDQVAATPTFSPAPGALRGPTAITLETATPDAVIHYTTDGTTPTALSPVYEAPIAAGVERVTIRAISVARCHFASAVADATYGSAGMPVGVGQKSYHLGNSLTDAINEYLKPIADSTGVTHGFARWTIPGCTIGFQAAASSVEMGTAEPEQARHVSAFAQSFKPDHMTIQPFADTTIAQQGPAAVTLVEPVVAANPDVQLWVYAQWPSTDPTKPNDEGRGYLQDELARGASWADWPAPAQPVPETWEDTADAQLRYHEAFADFVDEHVDGKPVLVIPGGSALATFKRRVDAGTFPGLSKFFGQVFSTSDDLHPNEHGRYLLSLLFYACMYRQNPESMVTFKPDVVSEEQAAALRQIAWQTASGYPRCGI